MQTLDAPVYEVNQTSTWYKKKIKQMEDQRRVFKKLNTQYFQDGGFSYYHSEHFGVAGQSKDFETYKDEVRKNPDKNGVHIFKVRSPHFPIFKALLEEIEEISPFKTHDVFGLNNVEASQWLGEKWFFQVKHEDLIKEPEILTLWNYTDYLQHVMDFLRKGETNEADENIEDNV